MLSRGKYEKSDDDMSVASSSHEQQISQNNSPRYDNHVESILVGKPDIETNGKFLEGIPTKPHQRRGSSSSNVFSPDTAFPPCKGDRYGIS